MPSSHNVSHSNACHHAGDWVLVHAAAGGTGQLLSQISSHLGARVIGTTSTPEKAEVARQAGAQEVRGIWVEGDWIMSVDDVDALVGLKVIGS
jgi:NADPH2:quinone reductase